VAWRVQDLRRSAQLIGAELRKKRFDAVTARRACGKVASRGHAAI